MTCLLIRDLTLSTVELKTRGRAMFTKMYGETADEVQTLLDNVFPDFGTSKSTLPCGNDTELLPSH